MERLDAEVTRYQPDAAAGLTDEQVLQRQRQGLVNKGGEITTKSIGRIIRDNVFTLFNFVITLLGFAVLLVGSFKNLLFMGVMLCNIIIGIVQEVRTKITVDRLSILSETKAGVIRGGQKKAVPIEGIVLDDIVELSAGGQVSADCVLLTGECGVNESLVTGESDVLHKKQGELLLSGSFLVSGKCRARVEHVGDDNYVATISSGAKYYKKVKSEIMESVRKIIRAVSICIVPLGILTFLNQSNMEGSTLQSAVVSTAAALIGMIPEGLVLLTSTVMAVGIIRLSKYKVMVQELYCIEALARVDVLCLDKTGTITEGSMQLVETIPLNGTGEKEITQVLNNFCRLSEDFSPTFQAIRSVHLNEQAEEWTLSREIPFASETKWSGMEFQGKGTYVLGAPEFVMQELPGGISQILNTKAQENRVLLLAKSDTGFQGDRRLPDNLCPMAFLVIQDIIRPEAKETLEYFALQGVELKVISGDNPVTVSNIARRAGLRNADAYIDAAQLETPEDIEKAVGKYTVFGRVTPMQKKQMVVALKKQGHTVAMTGDGVNDVLALKEADCSVAMASGSDAARNVAQLVLLDSNFAAMPQVVAEGRRSINNLQRSSSLFLVKTIFSFCLTILFLLLSKPYPFVPIQLTMISGLTIGFPSFILALEPNRERIQGHFMRNVLTRSAPGALSVVIGVVAMTFLGPLAGLSYNQVSTLCVLLTACAGVLLIIRLSIPFNLIRSLLLGAVLAGLVIAVSFLGDFFSIAPFTREMYLWSAGAMVLTGLLFEGFYSFMNRRKQVKA